MGNLRFLNEIFSQIRIGISFRDQLVDSREFGLTETSDRDDQISYEGVWNGITLTLLVKRVDAHLVKIRAQLHNGRPFHCDKIVFDFLYHKKQADFSECYVPGGNMNCGIAGLKKLKNTPVTPEDVRFCGLFHSSTEPCLLFGTVIPSNMILKYQAALEEKDRVCFTATNYFTSSRSDQYHVTTETICVITGLNPAAAIAYYGQQLPEIAGEAFAEPLIGWSTWDYYFTAINPEDLEENMLAIRSDPTLAEKVKYFFVDDGWQHREGEWYANYRFPMGTKGIARSIRENGFVPGIWTNGCQAWFLTHTGLRHPEMMLKDEQGNAITFEDRLVIDPTHPVSEHYIFETYKRLREDGFRAFKVDFVSSILLAKEFHQPQYGPYGAIRKLFSIIRKAIGEDSILIGCSYPSDCGPGYVDSCRFAVDIHNQWEHVLWVMESMQMSFWEHKRLYRLDPDFLVVRGSQTSVEAETNVFNPAPNLPFKENAPSNRWRKGPVFDANEAESWANLVVFCAGNIILGDRISKLNPQGMELVQKYLEPNKEAAVPLDLGDDFHASVWYSQEDHKLLLLNLEDTPCEKVMEFARFGLPAPTEIFCSKPFVYENGVVRILLQKHESAVFTWQ